MRSPEQAMRYVGEAIEVYGELIAEHLATLSLAEQQRLLGEPEAPYSWLMEVPWCKVHSAQFWGPTSQRCLWSESVGPSRLGRSGCEKIMAKVRVEEVRK